jgi:hypothetical protein
VVHEVVPVVIPFKFRSFHPFKKTYCDLAKFFWWFWFWLKMESLPTSDGTLFHLLDNVFKADSNSLVIFFEYHGISDINDFMSFTEIDFNSFYMSLDNPETQLSLSIGLIKKLLSVQSWYVSRLAESDDNPLDIIYSLTPE